MDPTNKPLPGYEHLYPDREIKNKKEQSDAERMQVLKEKLTKGLNEDANTDSLSKIRSLLRNYIKDYNDDSALDSKIKKLNKLVKFIAQENITPKQVENACKRLKYEGEMFKNIMTSINEGFKNVISITKAHINSPDISDSYNFGELTKDQVVKIYQDASLLLGKRNLQIHYTEKGKPQTYEQEGADKYELLLKDLYDLIAFRYIPRLKSEVSIYLLSTYEYIRDALISDPKKSQNNLMCCLNPNNDGITVLYWSKNSKAVKDKPLTSFNKIDKIFNFICITRKAVERMREEHASDKEKLVFLPKDNEFQFVKTEELIASQSDIQKEVK